MYFSRNKSRRYGDCALIAGLLSPALLISLGQIVMSAQANAEPTVLVPYESSIKYAVFQGPPPDEVLGPAYNDSAWAIGQAPFGSNAGTLCFSRLPVTTLWELPSSFLVLRLWVTIPEGSSLPTLCTRYVCNWDVAVNGRLYGSSQGWRDNYCPWSYVEMWIGFSSGLTAGRNLFVLVCATNEVPRYFDLSITADVPTVAADASSWGRIKALFH